MTVIFGAIKPSNTPKTTPIPIFRIKFIFFHTDIILFTHLPPNKYFSIIAEKSSQVNSLGF
ncbi:hypothetical protein TL13_1279 [Streptococcus suis TL13]|nr:hypothetical protein TL13_1279 [Streptococcus suis TL13]